MNIIKMFLGIILSAIMVSGNCVGITNLIKKDVEFTDVSNTQEEISASSIETKETSKVVTTATPKITQTKPIVTTQKEEKTTPTTPKIETAENKQPTPTSSPYIQEQPINNTQAVATEKPKETFEVNYEMIEKLKQTIKANESEYMKTYGYEIVVDSSIKGKTNPFTFTEARIKPMIKYSFGTIRIYAENYYVGGQLVMVDCYLL